MESETMGAMEFFKEYWPWLAGSLATIAALIGEMRVKVSRNTKDISEMKEERNNDLEKIYNKLNDNSRAISELPLEIIKQLKDLGMIK